MFSSELKVQRILDIIRATGFVAYDINGGRDGTSVHRAHVWCTYGQTRVTLTAWDGISHTLQNEMFISLEQQLAGRRQATPEEVADYERLERPAPDNWN